MSLSRIRSIYLWSFKKASNFFLYYNKSTKINCLRRKYLKSSNLGVVSTPSSCIHVQLSWTNLYGPSLYFPARYTSYSASRQGLLMQLGWRGLVKCTIKRGGCDFIYRSIPGPAYIFWMCFTVVTAEWTIEFLGNFLNLCMVYLRFHSNTFSFWLSFILHKWFVLLKKFEVKFRVQIGEELW